MNSSIDGFLAHAGHGMTASESPLHLLEPIHAVWIVAVVVLPTLARFAYRYWITAKQEARQPARRDN